MNIDHLRYFLVLSQELHYGRAAQRLNISQSGLSHAICTLEKELGAPLFEKSGRGVVLGRYGQLLLPTAKEILSRSENCIHSFQMIQKGTGVIRLRTIPLLIIPTVTALARRFLEHEPGCDFAFSTGMSSEVYRDLKERRIDVGFCSKTYPDPEIEYAPILRCSMIVAVPLDHPLAARESVTLEETLAFPHIAYSWLSGQRDIIDPLFDPVREKWNIAYEVEDANFIVELVAQGFGLAVMLRTPPVFREDIKLLRLTAPEVACDFSVARRREPHVLTSVDRFFTFCAESYRDES